MALLLAWMAVAGTSPVRSDTQRILEYQYDDAGNIIRVESALNKNPPVVSGLSPSAIRIGLPVTVTANGTDLKKPEIIADHPGLTISNVSSSNTEVVFDLQATDNVPLGEHTLTFSTQLGSDTEQILIRPRLPVLFVSPAPVTAPANGTPVNLVIELSAADIFPHTLNLSTGDGTIATVSPSSITIPAGDIRPSENIQVTGQARGVTSLDITSAVLADYSTNVFVTDVFQPTAGDHSVHAAPLGVVLTPAAQPPSLITRAPFIDHLGIFKEAADAPIDVQVSPVTSPNLGVAFGSVITQVSPRALVADESTTDVAISGFGLVNVTSVDVHPADDITLGGPAVDANGESVTVPVTVAEGAAIGSRQLDVREGTERIHAAEPEITQIFISRDVPELIAVSPIVLTRTQTATLTLRGRNFQDTESVTLIPADGITSAPFHVNEDGTQITMALSVAEFAPLGQRVVNVTTGAGSSGTTASEKNTIEIVNGPVTTYDSILAPAVGVHIGEVAPPEPEIGLIRMPSLGVVLGGAVTGLVPASEAVGSEFVLTVQGNGLQDVSEVRFVPDDGIVAGPPAVATDGNSLTLDVLIDADAPRSLRRVAVLAEGEELPAASPDTNRFQVTGLQPVVSSVTPNHVVRGAASSDFIVNGRFLNDAQQVRIIPADDMSVGSPVVSGDGNSLTVTISADGGAATGPRTVVVETPGGESSTSPDAANTLNVVNEVVQTVTPVIAPSLGVEKQTSDGAAPEIDRLIIAPHLGIVVEQTSTPASRDVPLFADNLGVAKGRFAKTITPAAIPIDTTADVLIEGSGLDTVDNIIISPDDGITQNGFFTGAGGSELTLSVTVDPAAPQTIREIVLNTLDEPVTFSDPGGNRLRIANALPSITSIEPIQEVAGATFDLVIRGLNLENVISVDITPSENIEFGTPTISPDGRQITIQMNISEFALPGPRVVTVTTPAGTTSGEPTAANTFTVIVE